MQKNKNLNDAKKAKNDEFYTQIEDIRKEIAHYKDKIKGKIIYCNCDNPTWSNFYKYFKDNFKSLGIKLLISTFYSESETVYKTIYNGIDEIKEPLKGNGDFSSPECIEILKASDIVITNPPFSLFRKFISTLISYEKHFLIIGSQNAIKYKEIFPLIKNDKIWLGCNNGSFKFLVPDTYDKANIKVDKSGNKYTQLGNIAWYSNIETKKRYQNLDLTNTYDSNKHLKYDNYNAINIDRTVDIPGDYKGVMGVPISFLTKYNPNQFEIIGELNHGSDNKYDFEKPIVNKVEKFPRILIKRKGVI